MSGPSINDITMNPTFGSSGSGTTDPSALIAALTGQGESAEQMRALATRASIPVPGGSGQEMPASLLYNPTKYTPGQIDKTPVVGAGNAKAQGIGNAVTGALNMIAAVKSTEDNKKKLQIATDTHTLLVEQNNINQATQAMAALPPDSPQRKQLQDAIDASKARMNGVLSDKKTATAIAKGFHIDFTDPQANNTDEHQGVQQGQKMAEKTLADQFMQKAPAPVGPNTVAQAQYASAMQQQQLQQKTMQAFIPLVRAMMQQQTASENREASFTREQYHEAMENARNMTTNQTRYTDTLAQIQGRKDLANTEFGQRAALIGLEGQKTLETFSQELTMKQSDPLEQIKAYNDFQTKSAITQGKNATLVSDLEAQRQVVAAKKPYDANAVHAIDEQIQMAKQVQDSYNKSVDAQQKYYNQLAGVKEGGSDGGTGSDNTSGLSSSSTYLGAPDDSEDDDDDSGTN